MTTTTFKTVRLVLAELGADGDRWVEAWEAGERPVLHLIQQVTETTAEFADRVREALEALAEADRIPEKAVLLAGPGADADALVARYFSLRLVLSAMVRQGGGEVYLVGDRRERLAMQSLASTSQEMVRGTGVSVQVAASAPAVAAA